MDAQQAPESALDSTPNDHELQTFVGGGNYLSKWQVMRTRGSVLAGFNFWAFLFVHSYFFYRKMYMWGFIFLAASLLGGVGTGALYGFIGAKYHFFSNMEQLKQQATTLGLVVLMLTMLTSGILANRIYYSFATFSIQEISKLGLKDENLLLAIKGKGGVSMVGFLAGVTINVFEKIFLG